ncbi:carboxypeptidase regulatory-like domain-containing protein [Pyxidicoccus fallax]|uniref:Carboxypeptidase regulatory-like domain-containing protein n=1 Tax=Pyxidicoccus fallax TaxID=394095 RepID=A0A848LEF7_9BACT|nr:carboxypeptidase-like regulatory domain-containing protein [Pyxidicoccus fallax]NMO15213.1 carboxypeptidase regulatory-like domain-containing protein [Pyxidicoccus fallax]NPC76912.1 carboxypeptidase regulatory-like domain-containing protein [Pyxidicoccus fallax]
MSLSKLAARKWLLMCGVLGGAAVLGAACGAPEAEVEPQAQQSQPVAAVCSRVQGATTICGVVTNASGTPLAGAEVNLQGVRVLTGTDGSFSVSSTTLSPGGPLTISARGYMPHVGAVTRDVLGARFVLHTLHQQTFTGGIVQVTDPRSGAGIRVDLERLVSTTGKEIVRPLTVGVRFIDTGLLAMPGADGAINLAGQSVFLETRGAIYTEVRDANGSQLKLAAGSNAQVFIPISASMSTNAPPTIALWSMGPGTNVWRQQPSTAGQTSNPVRCDSRQPVACGADHCDGGASSTRYTGNTNEIGFINADIEKNNPACLRIDLNAAALPPGTTLPVCLELEIAIPGGGNQTRNICVGDGTDIMYNLPPNANITVRQMAGMGCPPPPGTSVIVNTGAPWGGTGMPTSPSQCNGVLTLPPLP